MEGIIRLKNVPITCRDCILHSWAIGCRYKNRINEAFKTTRPDWCPIEIENKDGIHDED